MAAKSVAKETDPFSGLKAGNAVGEIAGGSPWRDVNQEKLLAFVVAVTGRGDAVVVGVTSDGGAMSITLLSKGEKRRFYEHDADRMDELLDEITAWAENA